jgi:hypothetical protein
MKSIVTTSITIPLVVPHVIEQLLLSKFCPHLHIIGEAREGTPPCSVNLDTTMLRHMASESLPCISL